MSLNKWFKKKMTLLAMAMANVEKNALSQKSESLGSDTSTVTEKDTGTLMHSLKNNIITADVEALRWRMYKVLKASEGLTTKIIGYDNDNLPITETTKIDKKKSLKKIKLDNYDNYPLLMVVDTTPIVTSSNDVMDNDKIIIHNEPIINYNKEGFEESKTHGEISGEQYFATNKTDSPINIIRENPTKFDIESYTKKLNIRVIDEKKHLLEFYLSKYPDDEDRRSRLFISDIKKAIIEPRHSTILDIMGINFITYKTLGVEDFLEYEYKVINFDKIVEFNGYYIVKFICEIIKDGIDIVEEHRVHDLDKKYENKEKK